MFLLSDTLIFPPTYNAHEDGLLCIGGDLSIDRLILAYRNGIFPWYNEDEPILWYSPDPRFVLFPHQLKVSKSMQQLIQRNEFSWSMNRDFKSVIYQCRHQTRKGQSGTWLNDDMEKAYIKLHELGDAHSFECWKEGLLIGGLYGVIVNKIFCGESMFSIESNASKFAFINMVRYLQQRGIKLIDCQVFTPHLESLGAEMITREAFELYLSPNRYRSGY